MTPDNFSNLFLNFQVWTIVKIFVSLGLFVYVAFAFVIIRQVDLMTKAINFSLDGVLKILAAIHMVGAILLLLIALVVL
jgi:hypothetical protein